MEPIGLSSKQYTLIVRCVDESMPFTIFLAIYTIVVFLLLIQISL